MNDGGKTPCNFTGIMLNEPHHAGHRMIKKDAVMKKTAFQREGHEAVSAKKA